MKAMGFASSAPRQRASVRKFYMYYCSIIRQIDNVAMDTSKSKRLVVQFAENLKECEHICRVNSDGSETSLENCG